MYSSSSSATHHIFFPPRLEVVVQKQDPDRLSADAGDQFAFDRLMDNQPHRPAGPSPGRLAANHGDDPLSLALIENGGSARARLFVEGGLQSTLSIAVADVANGLG